MTYLDRTTHERLWHPAVGAEERVNIGARKALVASRLAAALNCHDIFPESVLALADGVVVLASRPVDGVQLRGNREWDDVLPKIKPHSLSRALAFSFFVGDGDANSRNFTVEGVAEASIHFFDPGRMFLENLPHDLHPFGAHLPKKYDRNFVAHLMLLTPDEIYRLVGVDLARSEMVALLNRRKVMLRDIDSKGTDAFVD